MDWVTQSQKKQRCDTARGAALASATNCAAQIAPVPAGRCEDRSIRPASLTSLGLTAWKWLMPRAVGSGKIPALPQQTPGAGGTGTKLS